MVFKITRSDVKNKGFVRKREISDEISVLIADSLWARKVDKFIIRNLTTNEVSDTELELLSLGIDLKLQGANKSIIDTIVAFKEYDDRYRNEPGKPDLHREKMKLLSDLSKDSSEILPRRYRNALTSIKANKDIMVLQSDKGKECVVCYRRTYLTLLEDHFSNTSHYQPVDVADEAGMDLDCMTNDLIDKLNSLAAGAPNLRHKNSLKAFSLLRNLVFPQAMLVLKHTKLA